MIEPPNACMNENENSLSLTLIRYKYSLEKDDDVTRRKVVLF